MFCSKCGKEIFDEAIVCPSCGCPTANYNSKNSVQPAQSYSDDYPKIKAFGEKVKTIKTLGIIATVLMFGIGIIFGIIAFVLSKKLEIPVINTTNSQEKAELDSYKRGLKVAETLIGISFVGFGVAIAVGFIIGTYLTY